MTLARVVALTATIASGSVAWASNNPPVPVVTVIPSHVAPNQPVTLDGSSSRDPDPGDSIVQFQWDFNGDGIYDATGAVVTYSWPMFGDYVVTLAVTDTMGATATVMSSPVAVDLGNLPPIAAPGGPYLVPKGSGVTLDGSGSTDPNAASGDFIVQYGWDLNGDSVVDLTGVKPVLTATQVNGLGVGTHTITLRVSDLFGATSVASTTLTLFSPVPSMPKWALASLALVLVCWELRRRRHAA